MKKMLFTFGCLGLIFSSGLCIKQKFCNENTCIDAASQIKNIKDTSLKVVVTLYKMMKGTWINVSSDGDRYCPSFKISGDTMTFMTSSKEEKYRIEITEDSLFGGRQVQNKQEALKYKPKILLPMKIDKLTKDSLVFGDWESGKKKYIRYFKNRS